MNSNRSSSAVVLLGLLLVAAVAPAAAAVPSVEGSAPDTVQVGADVEQTYTLTDPFTEYNEWTLTGQTDLSEVTWTITTYDNTDQRITQETYTGQSFSHHLSASSGVVRVEVQIEATVPDVPNSLWRYDPPQQYTVVALNQTQEGGSSTTIATYETRPYTEQSSQARTQIDAAESAVQKAQNNDVSVPEAKKTLQNAISAYNSANFDLAIDLANEAERKAESAIESAQQSQQTTQLLLYGGVALVVVLLAVGGFLYYRRNQGSQDKLA